VTLIGNQILLASGDPMAHNYDYSILSYDGWAILSNHILIMLAVTVFMLWWMPRVGRAVATGTTGTSHDYVTKNPLAHMIEVMCIFFREDICRPVMGPFTDRYVPVVWTFFFFILFNNLIGLFPLTDVTALAYKAFAGSGETHVAQVVHDESSSAAHLPDSMAVSGDGASVGAEEAHGGDALSEEDPSGGHDGGHDEEHHSVWNIGPFVAFQDLTQPVPASHFHGIGGTPTGNIAVTGALALVSILLVIGAAIRNLGLMGFLHHLTLDAPVPLWPLTIFLEIVGLIAKPFALMVRLFANMTAGHLMLAALLGFTSMAWNGFVTYLNWTGSGGSPEVAISVGGLIGFVPIAVGSIVFATAVGLLELLVAFIQAFVFAFLTAMFISMFLPHEHEHPSAHEDEPNAPAGAVAF